MKKIVCLMLLLMLARAGGLYAQAGIMDLADDSAKVSQEDLEKEKKKKFDFSLHGFVRTNIAVEKDNNEFAENDVEFAKVGTILQLQIEGYLGSIGHLYSATNFDFNFLDIKKMEDDLSNSSEYIDPRPRIRVVEAYIDIYPTRWMTIRAGQQLTTWGEIEGIEAPTDIICPQNYTTKSSVFEDSKMGVTALDLNFYFARQRIELMWIPIFQPSDLPTKDIIKKRDDLGSDIKIASTFWTDKPGRFTLTKPSLNINHGEYAARMTGDITNVFRYGLGFLYGYSDLPDSEINYDTSPDLSGNYLADTTTLEVHLLYTRMMTPTIDLNFNIRDKASIKVSSALHITRDWEGKRDDQRNSDFMYLVGVESTNIGADIYFALYAGQTWIVNYTSEHGVVSTLDPNQKYNLISNEMMLKGFDQYYPYKWIISGIIQKSFLERNNFEVSLRYAISASPEFDAVDYVVNLNFCYEIIDNLSATLGLIAANKIDVIKNMAILEVQYSF